MFNLFLLTIGLATSTTTFAQNDTISLIPPGTHYSPYMAIIAVSGKFTLRNDGEVVLLPGVTASQAADSFAELVPFGASFEGVRANLCLTSEAWQACLKPDGHVAYNGKPLPRETVEFLDLAAAKMVKK